MGDEFFDPFAMDYDTSDVSEETVHDGGGSIVQKEGRYHVQVTDVEYRPAEVSGEGEEAVRKLPSVEMKMLVLAGDHDSEVGKTCFHTIYLATWTDPEGNRRKDEGQMFPVSEKKMHGILALLHAFGVVGGEVFGKEKVKITKDMFLRLEQTQAIVKLTMEEARVDSKTGREYSPRVRMVWDNDCWPLSHKKVEDVNKDASAMAYAGTGEVPDDDLDDI